MSRFRPRPDSNDPPRPSDLADTRRSPLQKSRVPRRRDVLDAFEIEPGEDESPDLADWEWETTRNKED